MKITVLSGALPRAGIVPEMGNPETNKEKAEKREYIS